MPDGFTVSLGLALRLFGPTIEVARLVCECWVAASTALFALAFRKLSVSWQIGVLSTLVLLTPPVIFAANMVRMEAPLSLLLAGALILHVYGFRLAAGSLLWGSLLFHPALAFAAVAYVPACWVAPRKTTTSRTAKFVGIFILAAVACAIVGESIHILHHVTLFRAHMSVQAARKLRLPLRSRLAKPQAVILFLAVLLMAWMIVRGKRIATSNTMEDVLPLGAVAVGIMLYAVLGAEMAYDIYSLSIGPAIVFCLIGRTLHDTVWGVPFLRSHSVAAG